MNNVMNKQEQLYRLIWLSRPLMQAAEARVEKALDGTGLTVRMRAVLEILHVHGDATVPEIALKLEIQRQYVQVMVNETLAEGLTVGEPNPRHRRSTMIALTPKGKRLIEEVITRENHIVQRMATGIRAEDIATALNVVTEMIAKLKADAEDQSA